MEERRALADARCFGRGGGRESGYELSPLVQIQKLIALLSPNLTIFQYGATGN